MAWLNSTVLSFRFLSYRQEKICREGSAIQLARKCAQTVSTHLLSNHFVSERSEGVVWFFLFRKKHVTSSKLDTAWQTHRSPMEQLWVTTGEMSHIMYLRFSSIAASIHLNFEKCKMFDQILGSLLLLYTMSHSATWKGNMPKWAATSSALLWRIEGFRQCLGFEVLFESQHFYLNYPGRQGLRTAPRIESIGPSDLKDIEHGKIWKKNKAPSKFPERNPLNLLPSSSQIAKDSESIYYRLRPQHRYISLLYHDIFRCEKQHHDWSVRWPDSAGTRTYGACAIWNMGNIIVGCPHSSAGSGVWAAGLSSSLDRPDISVPMP